MRQKSFSVKLFSSKLYKYIFFEEGYGNEIPREGKHIESYL